MKSKRYRHKITELDLYSVEDIMRTKMKDLPDAIADAFDEGELVRTRKGIFVNDFGSYYKATPEDFIAVEYRGKEFDGIKPVRKDEVAWFYEPVK